MLPLNKFLILFGMCKLLELFKVFVEFITTKIWKIRLSKLSKRQGALIKQLRVITLAVKRFNIDNCLVSATALTFYTVFSIVPILALAFAMPVIKSSAIAPMTTKSILKDGAVITSMNRSVPPQNIFAVLKRTVFESMII